MNYTGHYSGCLILEISQILQDLIYRYGIIGVFIVSLLGNSIPYSTIPYLILIIIYAGSVDDPLLHLAITISGGLGAALGKVVVYYFGWGIRKVLPDKTRENMEVFAKLFKNSVFLAVLLFAALPLPDDILYIPLGASGYSLRRYFIALVIGKIIITGLAVFFGSYFKFLMNTAGKVPDYITIPVLLVVTLYLTYIVIRIDWVEVARTASKKGLVRALIYLFVQVVLITIDIFKKPIQWIKG